VTKLIGNDKTTTVQSVSSQPDHTLAAASFIAEATSEKPVSVPMVTTGSRMQQQQQQNATIGFSNFTDKSASKASNHQDDLALAARMQDSLPYLMNSVNQSMLELIGYQLDDLLVWCRFAGRACILKEEFQSFVDPNYGRCFTFNANVDSRFIQRGGQKLGLKVLFRTPTNDNMPFVTSAGYKLIFHEPGEQPVMAMAGITCSPGQYYTFSLRKLTHQMEASYKSCSTNATTTTFYANKSYTLETCLGTCYQKMIFKLCKCGDPRYPLPTGHVYCSIEQKACVDKAALQSSDFMSKCECLPSCRIEMFPSVQSKAIWPSISYVPPDCEGKSETNLIDCRINFTKGYSRVDIYYGVTTSTSNEEYAQYTIMELASDLFAHLGLWISFCIFSVFEVVVFPTLAILEKLKKYRKN